MNLGDGHVCRLDLLLRYRPSVITYSIYFDEGLPAVNAK